MRARFVKLDDNKKILYIDAKIIYGHSMSQPLPYDEIEMWTRHTDDYKDKLKEKLYTPMIVILVFSWKLI